MQRGHLVVFLAHDEEELNNIGQTNRGLRDKSELTVGIVNVCIFITYRVEEFCELGKVVPPATTSHLFAKKKKKNQTIIMCNTALSIGNSETSFVEEVIEQNMV